MLRWNWKPHSEPAKSARRLHSSRRHDVSLRVGRGRADVTDREIATDCAGTDRATHMSGGSSIGVKIMRFVLALGLSITLCASADAAPLHHSKPRHPIVSRSQDVHAPARFAVPGWTDEQTQYWLNRGPSACAGCG